MLVHIWVHNFLRGNHLECRKTTSKKRKKVHSVRNKVKFHNITNTLTYVSTFTLIIFIQLSLIKHCVLQFNNLSPPPPTAPLAPPALVYLSITARHNAHWLYLTPEQQGYRLLPSITQTGGLILSQTFPTSP